ncbi:hypothetical protein ElyMa_003514900, partial [Elysia marginata]
LHRQLEICSFTGTINKVALYLGQDSNIVGFIGAQTADLHREEKSFTFWRDPAKTSGGNYTLEARCSTAESETFELTGALAIALDISSGDYEDNEISECFRILQPLVVGRIHSSRYVHAYKILYLFYMAVRHEFLWRSSPFYFATYMKNMEVIKDLIFNTTVQSTEELHRYTRYQLEAVVRILDNTSLKLSQTQVLVTDNVYLWSPDRNPNCGTVHLYVYTKTHDKRLDLGFFKLPIRLSFQNVHERDKAMKVPMEVIKADDSVLESNCIIFWIERSHHRNLTLEIDISGPDTSSFSFYAVPYNVIFRLYETTCLYLERDDWEQGDACRKLSYENRVDCECTKHATYSAGHHSRLKKIRWLTIDALTFHGPSFALTFVVSMLIIGFLYFNYWAYFTDRLEKDCYQTHVMHKMYNPTSPEQFLVCISTEGFPGSGTDAKIGFLLIGKSGALQFVTPEGNFTYATGSEIWTVVSSDIGIGRVTGINIRCDKVVGGSLPNP